ncbi:MAG TPA: c-type cytochrome [Pseudomonas xinjiangensis]|uniref:Cytochrome c-551 n=2 Tax=root TaxID=1 RepID=A0A7V1FU83_9GAMM|nr:c-type cytochrome [Halopseudomonas xinjiangensis]HEC47014.1 c-type cytochrome [Halopseudomonas xinjiangensis]
MKHYLLSVLAFGALLSTQATVAQDAEELFKSKPCGACHSLDTKLVGPALKDVAAKYENTEENVAMLADHIKNGVVGNWGQIPMPANQVTEEEAKTLAQWILSLN